MSKQPIKKLRKIDLRAKQFARQYIKNDFNGTKTVLEMYNTTDKKTAGVIAVENLAKPSFQKAIIEEMEKRGLNDEMVLKELEYNIKQYKHLPSKNTAMDMYFKLKGDYAPEKKLSVNVDIPPDIDKEIENIIQELKAPQEGN